MTSSLISPLRENNEEHHKKHPKKNFLGKYLLLQTIGEGEFAKVKLALGLETGDEFAIKLVKKEWVDTEAKLTKINREISVLKNINHPYIVRLYDIIEADKYIGLVLEYASGGELFDHILVHRYLKEKEACRLFAQLISAVFYLHQNGIVHRDLKLENLLLDWNKNVKITDFGFANVFDPNYGEFMMTSCGSPCYAAPELVVSDGMYAGTTVDIWSCGVILYAMLAGYLPFDDDPTNPNGDNINKLYKYILSTKLTFPSHIGELACDLLCKILVPDPKKRANIETIMAHKWLEPYSYIFKDISEKTKPKTTIDDLNNDQAPAPNTDSSNNLNSNQDNSFQHNPYNDNNILANSNQIVPQSYNKDSNHQNGKNHRESVSSKAPNAHHHNSFPNLSKINLRSSTDAENHAGEIADNNMKNNEDNLSGVIPKSRTYTIPVDDSNHMFKPYSSTNAVNIPLVEPTIPSADITEKYFPENSYLNKDFDIFENSSNQEFNIKDSNLSNFNQKYDSNLQTQNESQIITSKDNNPILSPNSTEKFKKYNDYYKEYDNSYNQPNLISNTSSNLKSSSNSEINLQAKDLYLKGANIKKAKFILGMSQTKTPKDDSTLDNINADIALAHSNIGQELGIKIGDGIASYPIKKRIPKLLSDYNGIRAFNWVAKQSRRITSSGGEFGFGSLGKYQNHQTIDTASKKKQKQRFQLNDVSFSNTPNLAPGDNINDLQPLSDQKNMITNNYSLNNTEIQKFVLEEPEILQQMRTYTGPINTLSLSSMPPSELFQHILQTLDNLGFVVVSTSGLSVRVLRPKMESAIAAKSFVIGATYPILLSDDSEKKIINTNIKNLSKDNQKAQSSKSDSSIAAMLPGYNQEGNSSHPKIDVNKLNIVNSNENKLVNHVNLFMSNSWDHSTVSENISANFKFVKTKHTYVYPKHETTPVDGSNRDRGIHGQFNKISQEKSKQQVSSLSTKLKNLKIVFKKNSKQSASKNTERFPQKSNISNLNDIAKSESDFRSENVDSNNYNFNLQNKALNNIVSTHAYSEHSSIEDTVFLKKDTYSQNTQLSDSQSNNQLLNYENAKTSQEQNSGPKYIPAKVTPVPPPYGQSHLDKKDEVQFVIEVCKLKNLSHLFVVTSKRRKGSVWAYKYLYYLFMESLNLKNYGNLTTNPYASIIVPSNNKPNNMAQISYNESNNINFSTRRQSQNRNFSNSDVKNFQNKYDTLNNKNNNDI
ncbi:hypothetical protein BB561_000109 [Smittium simulii]|uniref:non-specific serine/threonine protein kinase n=1 Tax=Smittium simulii TaxID=133385 RepID=A0A2T9Z0K7_9FUNG|nr:hypothetical protein BB561_000109 [Smittium simulii]